MDNRLKYGLILIATHAIVFSIGKFLTPPKVSTVTVEKIVYKDRIIEDTSKNIKKHVVETKKPDGTVTIVTDIGEKDNDHKSETLDKSTASSQTTVVTNRPDWRVGLAYNPSIPSFQNQRITGIIERRIISEVYLGATVANDHSFGLVVTIGL
jgi:hypothetical protein